MSCFNLYSTLIRENFVTIFIIKLQNVFLGDFHSPTLIIGQGVAAPVVVDAMSLFFNDGKEPPLDFRIFYIAHPEASFRSQSTFKEFIIYSRECEQAKPVRLQMEL